MRRHHQHSSHHHHIHITTSRAAMATVRQCVSLVIFLTVLTTVFVLNYLSIQGHWSPADAAGDALLDPRESAGGAGAGAGASAGGWGGKLFGGGIQGGNGGGAGGGSGRSSWDQARERQSPAVLLTPSSLLLSAAKCQEEGGRSRLSFTSEELGLVDVDEPVDVARRKRNPLHKTPETERWKIAPLLKSRNPCRRNDKRGSAGLACLPYYYLAGFPKCGSTDLFLRLTSHPDIVRDPHKRKELNWIAQGRFSFPNGRTDALESYKDLFGKTLLFSQNSAQNMTRVIIGDHSSSTVWDNSQWRLMPVNRNCSQPLAITADVVRHLNPGAKVIVTVRNPTERLYSEHLVFNRNSTKETFHRLAVNAVREATECFKRNGVRRCAYAAWNDLRPPLHVGLYYVYINDWLRRFPRDQMHVIRLEDMAVDRKEVLRKAFAFLGVEDPDEVTLEAILKPPVASAGSRRRRVGPMLPETRHLLDRFYRPFNVQLARLLSDSKYEWSDTMPSVNGRTV